MYFVRLFGMCMRTNQQDVFIEDCSQIAGTLKEMISNYLPDDAFCVKKRKDFIKDVESNIFVQRCSSIVSIIEYSTNMYIYVSEKIKDEINVTAKELVAQGLVRAFVEFPEPQLKIIVGQIYPTIFKFYENYAACNEAKDLHVSYNTLLKTPDGEYKWFLHQLAVLSCDERGFPNYGLKFLSSIDQFKKDDTINVTICKKSAEGKQQLLFSKDFLCHPSHELLSKREIEIIELTNAGHTSKEIAEKLFISLNTVNTHKRNVSRKAREVAS